MTMSFAPLRHRSFALMWSAAFVSNIGTWMETVALGYYVTDVTGKAAWSAVIAAAGFVPMALLSPVGGALADRGSRRRLMFITTSVQAILAGVIAVLTAVGEPHPGVVALIVLGSGFASAIGFPAYMAMIPDLVPADELVAAVGLGSAQWNLGRVIGPAVAGVVMAIGGIPWALGINAASFFAVLIALTMIDVGTRPITTQHQRLRTAIADGARFVRAEPGLWLVFRIMCLTSLLGAPFIALLAAMTVKELDGGSATNAVLVTAQGIGAVVVALSMGDLVKRHGSRKVLSIGLAALVVSLVVYAAAPNTALVALALIPLGGAYLACLTSYTTIAQQRAPGALRGRVVSLNAMILGSLYPLGALVQGRLADAYGLRRVTAGAAVILGVVLIGSRLIRPDIMHPLDVPPSSDDVPMPMEA
ncbi:MAG: MFS transporter [Acidimicrobiia bacterium]